MSGTRKSLCGVGPSYLLPVETAISAGRVQGATALHLAGYNADVDIASAEDIIELGGTHPGVLSSAETFDVVSTSTNDNNSIGTGAKTVTVYGLDSNYALASETVNMNGTTAVTTSGSYFMLYLMEVATAGAAGTNSGVITADPTTTGTDRIQISAGEARSLSAFFMVPADTSLELGNYTFGQVGSTANFYLDVRLLVKPFGGVWQTHELIGAQTNGAAPFTREFSPPLHLPEKTAVKLQATAEADNSKVSGALSGTLVT